MAAFTIADKLAVGREFYGRHFQAQINATTPWTKVQLAAAIDSMNNWTDTNQANFLSTLATDALAFSSASTASQKSLLYCYVLLRRAGVI